MTQETMLLCPVRWLFHNRSAAPVGPDLCDIDRV